MDNELKRKTEEWMRLERKTVEQRKQADQYYDMELMSLIEKDFIKRNKSCINEKVECLIVSVGTSYEPIALNISLLAPEKVLFLYTKKSMATLDKVVEHCALKATRYEKSLVNEIDPVDIYREVKEIYLKWGKPDKMYIDFTGGTKAMSAACALAGAMVDMQMVYVASDDYLVDFRKPNPGSEKLIFIENPIAIFGDLEYEKAIELFTDYNFNGAVEILKFLKDSIPNPFSRQELNFSYLLAETYRYWDMLDFEDAARVMGTLCSQLKRDARNYPHNILVRQYKIVSAQKDYLIDLSKISGLIGQRKQPEILNTKQIIIPLMFTMKMNAWTREQQGKYDMATLLTYRLLEMMEQRRLAKYGLFVSDMRYDQIKPSEKLKSEVEGISSSGMAEWLRKEVSAIKKGMFGKVSDYLPNPVSLLDGFIILSALHDPIVYSASKNRMNILKKMRSMVFLRNNSIFAHGLGPVAYGEYEQFRNFVHMMFRQFCKIEGLDEEAMTAVFSWIIPVKKKGA